MSFPPALASSPAAQQLPPWRRRRHRLVPRPACVSRPSCDLALGSSARSRRQPQPHLVAAQSQPPSPFAAVGGVRRDAATALALLLLVLAADRKICVQSLGGRFWGPLEFCRNFAPSLQPSTQYSQQILVLNVMSCFLSLAILLFSASRTLHKLETGVNKLTKVVAEEAHGTLSSLKLSFLEINDLTSQLKNLRKRLTISRFGSEASTKASSRTGWPNQ